MTDQIDKAKIRLMMKKGSVFLSTILFSLKFVVTKEVTPTAAVSKDTLYLNPEFIKDLTTNELVGLLAHEAWHVAFDHLDRLDGRNPTLWNVAGDYVINLMLTKSGYTLPTRSLLDHRFENLSTEQVYELLDNENNTQEPDFGGDLKPSSEAPEQDKQKLDDLLIKAHTQASMAGEDAGELPDSIQRKLNELLNPVLPWNVILQNYMSSYDKEDYSYSRPNKRYLPEFYLPSLYSESCGEIAVAIDTSGSVTDADFSAFISEIQSIKDSLNPELLTIIDFDTKIKNVYEKTKEDTLDNLEFTGRGGTRLDCVFDYYKKKMPQVLIVFSDLHCTPYSEKPDYDVLWIVVNNRKARVNFGTTINYETN